MTLTPEPNGPAAGAMVTSLTATPPTRATGAKPDDRALDTAVWSALSGPHAALAAGDGNARRYPPDIAPFGAVRQLEPQALASLAALLGAGESVALVTAVELAPFEGLVSVRRSSLDQMVLADPVALAGVATAPMETLTIEDVPDMLNLTASTRPGPFGRRTIELGHYLGIRIDGRLVAMGGERLKVPGFTEISAICVEPQCRGRGYAAALVKRLTMDILARGEAPFLHVVRENVSAIALYERLGFRIRRGFSLGVFEAPASPRA